MLTSIESETVVLPPSQIIEKKQDTAPMIVAPVQDSIQLNKLKMAFDIALSSSLSAASYVITVHQNNNKTNSLDKVLAVLNPATKSQEELVTKLRLDALTTMSAHAYDEFAGICTDRDVGEKLVSLDKAILDSKSVGKSAAGVVVRDGGEGELEAQRAALAALMGEGREMEERLRVCEAELKGNVEGIEALTSGLVMAAEGIEETLW
jgi:hypothetical protein